MENQVIENAISYAKSKIEELQSKIAELKKELEICEKNGNHYHASFANMNISILQSQLSIYEDMLFRIIEY